MSAKIVILSALVAVAAGAVAKGNDKVVEGWITKVDDMDFCLTRENATDAEVRDFVIDKKFQDDNVPLKNSVLCFLKRINFFDGNTWNKEEIAKSEANEPEVLAVVYDCIAKDDVTQEPNDRAYFALKCVIENTPADK